MAGSSSAAPLAHELLLAHEPSASLERSEVRDTQKLCVVLHDFLRVRFARWLAARTGVPVLLSYCNGTTPFSLRRRVAMGEDRGTLVRTSGASVEYLIQRVWATDPKNATMGHFTARKRMLNKSAACHVAGVRKLALFPMELGNKSLNVSHGIWDRGIYTAAFRLFCQQHHRAVEGQLQTMPPGEAEVFRLQSWAVGNGCVDHDCHGALHRALASAMDDRGFMKLVYKQFAALRGGFGQLEEHVWDWVACSLIYEDWHLPTSVIEELRRTLGVEPEWAEDLCDLQLRYTDGGLRVAARHAEDPQVMRRTVRAQLRLWQFRTWSESRWLGIGARARSMTALCLVGIQGLVSFILDTKKGSAFHLGGLSLPQEVREFLGPVALASFVSEAALAAMFEDDRVVSVATVIRAEAHEEQAILEKLSPDVWRAITKALSIDARQLQSRTLLASHAQAAYLHYRLRYVDELPWSLCIGDIRASLEKLRTGPRPSDEHCAAKIWPAGVPTQSR